MSTALIGSFTPVADRRTIPFDLRFRFELPPRAPEARSRRAPAQTGSLVDRVFTSTVEVSIEAAFVAVAIGYGLVTEGAVSFGAGRLEDIDTVRPRRTAPAAASASLGTSATDAFRSVLSRRGMVTPEEGGLFATATTAARRAAVIRDLPAADRRSLERDVAALPPRRRFLGDFINALGRRLGEAEAVARGEIGPRTAIALQQGIRVRPDALRILLLEHGHEAVEGDAMDELFETIEAPPERIQFLYALFDEGTRRAFQNEPVLNVAGLGTADGGRPFRHFNPAIRFAPRSVIRLEITPKSEFRGELHVVLQGYKVLGGAGTPTGRALRRGRRRTATKRA